MVIGVPREIKKEEYRVGLTPSGASELKKDGHTVLVEPGAGEGSGFSDQDYLNADADLIDKERLFASSELIIKVKEPLPEEYHLLRLHQALSCYLHLAANPELTGVLLEKQVSAFAYETTGDRGTLPLLAPMSEIAGRMAPLMGALYLQRPAGGSGVFPCGAAGVAPAKCVILGAGNVGANAARVAVALGMDVTVLNRGVERLRRLDELYQGRVKTGPLSYSSISEAIKDADVVVGAVLVPGAKTPVLVTRDMLKTMRKGSVVVDVSVDQGGTFETTRPTTHADPVYVEEGIVHYTVANMPGAYPRTSTLALANSTLPFIKELARTGVEGAVAKTCPLRTALNVYRGRVVNAALASSMNAEPAELDELLSVKALIR